MVSNRETRKKRTRNVEQEKSPQPFWKHNTNHEAGALNVWCSASLATRLIRLATKLTSQFRAGSSASVDVGLFEAGHVQLSQSTMRLHDRQHTVYNRQTGRKTDRQTDRQTDKPIQESKRMRTPQLGGWFSQKRQKKTISVLVES